MNPNFWGTKSSSYWHSGKHVDHRMVIEATTRTNGRMSVDADSAVVSPFERPGEDKNMTKRDEEESLQSASMELLVLRDEPPQHEKQEDDQWQQAMNMIRDHRSILTPRVFLATLGQDPPAHVVRDMLSIAPQVASIPPEGPTALQVAVQQGACIGATRAVLEACPFALCVTNPHHTTDPLSYAKRHRKGEHELIELLSRPLSYWLSKRDSSGRSESDGDSIDSALDFGFVPNDKQPPTTPPPPPPNESPPPSPIPPFFPVSSPVVAEAATKINLRIDRKELNNVKLLCAQLLQGHKKLSKQLKTCQEQLKVDCKNNKRNDDDNNIESQELLLQQLQDQQQFHFRRQLIALDMKERAFLARVQKMEERCKQHSIEQFSSWKHSMDIWKTQTEDEWREWKTLLDHQVHVKAHLRGNATQWTEYFDEDTTQMLFSTDLGEMSEFAPLCNSLSISSDYQQFYGGRATMEGNDDDELLKVPPPRPRRLFAICR